MTPAPLEQPRVWSRYATDDAQEAETFITAAYAVGVELSQVPRTRFGLRSAGALLQDVAFGQIGYRAHLRVHTNPETGLGIAMLRQGRVRIGVREGTQLQEHAVGPGDVFFFPPERSNDVVCLGAHTTSVHLPRTLLEEAAEAGTGLPGARLRFEGTRALTPALQRHWWSTVEHVQRSVLAHQALAANPLVSAPARRLLAATALAVFPNTAQRAEQRSTGREARRQVAPAALRRAMAHAEERPGQDVSVAEMAVAAGVGVRALQQAFARHTGGTPSAYVRRVRLEHAHRDLQAADPTSGATVAAIAARWGFAHPGRFAGDYRTAYGQTPSHTLRT